MKTRTIFSCLSASFLLVLSGWAGVASAMLINFSAQLDVVTDSGGAVYSGSTIGQVFSGSFSYGTEAQASTDPLFPGDYDFSSPPFGGLISDGSTPTSGSSSVPVQVTIDNNVILDDPTADLLNALFETSYMEDSIVDIADIDTAFVSLPGGGEIVFGLSFISESTAWTDTDFANFPPESGNIGQALFFIAEVDSLDNVIFEGFGVLDTINTAAEVPLPSALWLFASGLAGVLGIARNRSRA